GRAHLGAEDRIDDLALNGAEPAEGQDRLLDGDRVVQRQGRSVAGGRQQVPAQLTDGPAHGDQRRGLGQLGRGRLRHEGHRAGGSRIGLDDVEDVGGHGELDVEQAAHADSLGDRQRRLTDAFEHVLAQGQRGQDAGRVAGVDAGLLDVLHDAADEDLLTVVERIDVDLDGVFEEAVDEHGTVDGDLRGRGHVVEQLGAVVDDLHPAAAEDVGGTYEHRVADLLGDVRGFL